LSGSNDPSQRTGVALSLERQRKRNVLDALQI